jgi:hypothetical protein
MLQVPRALWDDFLLLLRELHPSCLARKAPAYCDNRLSVASQGRSNLGDHRCGLGRSSDCAFRACRQRRHMGVRGPRGTTSRLRLGLQLVLVTREGQKVARGSRREPYSVEVLEGQGVPAKHLTPAAVLRTNSGLLHRQEPALPGLAPAMAAGKLLDECIGT